MSATYLTNGIILKRRPHREYDRIVTIFTEDDGKIEAIARGVRRMTSKLGGHLDLFAHAQFMLAHGKAFDIVATSVKRSSFRLPQRDLAAFGLTSYFCEAVDRLTPYHQADPELYALLVRFLHAIENGESAHGGSPALQRVLVTEFFLFQLLRQLGYVPQLEQCVIGKEPLGDQVFLSQHFGGLVCDEHRSQVPDAIPLTRQTQEALRLMADGELEPLRLMRRDAALRDVAMAVNGLLTYHLGAPLATEALIPDLLTATA